MKDKGEQREEAADAQGASSEKTGDDEEAQGRAARQRIFTRRALLGAGLALPVLLAVDRAGHAAVPPHAAPHADGHGDHGDHGDHSDHGDAAQVYTSHADHSDHSDHGDHGDVPHLDHADGPHADHADNSSPIHVDLWAEHNDRGTFSDTHSDSSHADSHTDVPHNDQIAHADHLSHGDHNDT